MNKVVKYCWILISERYTKCSAEILIQLLQGDRLQTSSRTLEFMSCKILRIYLVCITLKAMHDFKINAPAVLSIHQTN